jgi:hypothetical protein
MGQPGEIEEGLERALESPVGVPEGLDVYEHAEHLIGEEQALLSVPHGERAEHQHRRLGEVSAQLDRLEARLHERARWKQDLPPDAHAAGH